MPQAELVDRVRAALVGRRVREVRMFGGLSFMVDERMLAAARNGGELLLRIDPDSNADALAAGATQAHMGTGRSMGPGWVSVAPELLGSDAQLRRWLRRAEEFHAREAM